MISHINVSKVNKFVAVIIDGTVDQHLGAGIVAMYGSVGFSSGTPLRFSALSNAMITLLMLTIHCP